MAALAAVVAAFAAGCGGAPAQTTGTPAQTTGAPPHSATSGLTVGAQRKALATRYVAIAVAGNRRLEAEFGRLHHEDRMRLAAARRVIRPRPQAELERAPYDIRDWVAVPEA